MSDRVSQRYKIEEAERASKIYEETISMLKTEECFVNFFKDYDHRSVEKFIKHYAECKAEWYIHADKNHWMRLRDENKWREEAMCRFKDIFRKKLFDLKCRWVAGEMDMPGIEFSEDFVKWSNEPAMCTATEPITRGELECYLQFMQTEDPCAEEDLNKATPGGAVQLYHKGRSLYEKKHEIYIPDWFHFYNTRFGTGGLLHLPTIRTDLEWDYHDIWTKEFFAKTTDPETLKEWKHLPRAEKKILYEDPEKAKARDEEFMRALKERSKKWPPIVIYSTSDKKMMDELVPQIESREMVRLYKGYTEWKRREHNKIDVECLVEDLNDIENEQIPVGSHDDFRVALKDAYKKYAFKMVMEILPRIFDEYRECLGNGKPFDWDTMEYQSEPDNEMRKNILKARVWKGEPANFDFLKKKNLRV
jgi:hypothetical protein